MPSGMLLPASRTASSISSGICASKASAAASSARARSPAGVVDQSAAAAEALRSASSTSAAPATATVPTTSDRRAGLVTGEARPSRSRPSTIGDARCAPLRGGRHVARERRHDRTVREVEPARIDALLTEQPPRRRDARVGDARQRVDLIDRVRSDHVGGEPLVEYAVDEGRVGAVLEQPAYQVRQQILVLAHRRINATRPIKPFASRRPARKAPRPCRAAAGTRSCD